MNKNEEYKKKYLNALEWARKIVNGEKEFSCEEVEKEIFQELAEEDGEKIRKALIAFIKKRDRCGCDYDYDKLIAWLEKQSKQDVRYKYLEDLITADDIHQMAVNDAMVQEAKSKAIDALSKLGVSVLLGLEKQEKLPEGCVRKQAAEAKEALYTAEVETGDGGIKAVVTKEVSIKSEDEESKRWILEYLYDGLRKSDEQFKGQFKAAIAWLEKQGEQNIANSAKTCKNDSSLAELEKLGIQPIQLYETALKTYGFASQKWVLIEECGELIDAFAKAERGRAETEHLLEELADVSIMVGQMALAIGFEGFQEKRAEKLLRLKKRLEDKNKQNDKEE